MALKIYRSKRNFRITPEPKGGNRERGASTDGLLYVIQKHQATALHYDFRLEWGGVLLSWAIPKGPSLDPSVKRLAISTEDHPLEYGGFEGVIPEGEYGAGTVMLWDRGSWQPEDPDVENSLRNGELKFTLFGQKFRGSWVLVRTKTGYPAGSGRPGWLLIKHQDQFASESDVLREQSRSVSSNRSLAEIAQDGHGNVAKAARGDSIRGSRG